MSKIAKYSAAIFIFLLTTIVLATALSVYAQDETDQTDQVNPQPPPTFPLPPQGAQQAYVTILAASGGTTNPQPGSYTYTTGYYYNLTAIPYTGNKFLYWTIAGAYLLGHNLPPIQVPDPVPPDWAPSLPSTSTAGWDSLITSQNPLNVICGYGYNFTYQPVFAPTTAPTAGANTTVVTLLQALGGTSKVTAGAVSHSAPGTYTFASGQGLTIKATADDGYAFAYWIATGPTSTTLASSQEDISCQEGTTYSYQPVFIPHNAPATEQGIPVIYFYVAVIVLIIIAIIGIGAALMYRSRGKK